MTLNNTVQDYLKTIEAESSGITCPACGSILGMKRQGSTEMVLTENARLELDGYLASYRRYLEKLEMLLAQRNVDYKAYPGNYPFAREIAHYRRNSDSVELERGGVYKGIVAESVTGKLIQEIDFFEWNDLFYPFPRRTEQQNKISSDVQLIFNKTKDILIGGLEPRSIAGALMDLIFDQKYVAIWREKIINDQAESKLDLLLTEICPAIYWYLNTLQEMNEQSTPARQSPNQKNTQDASLKEGITRVKFIFAVILGHRSQDTKGFLKDIFISKDVPFTLPRKTVVSPKHLEKILRSNAVLDNPKIGFSQNLLQQLRQEYHKNEQLDLDNVSKLLKDEIHKFVHFTCTASISEKLNESNQQKGTPEVIAEKTCGWYPKPEETHSVILLGSPGTAKSSVMLTGVTTFYDNVAALGATISFESPEDEAMMKRLSDDYWAGKMPKPTAKGSQTTIKLSVEFPENGYPRTNFVFTDIPGETMAKSLTSEGSDPAVLRILKNAETIIFFFDISIEPSIRKKLTEENDGTWQVVQKNYERVCNNRVDKDANANAESKAISKNNDHQVRNSLDSDAESRAEVSQLQLLQKLIQDLQVQRGKESLKNDINFICVIPKIDLFANETNSQRYFFSSFFKELQEKDILVPSNRSRSDDSFAGLRSLGGTSVRLLEGASNSSTNGNGYSRVREQKEIGRWISDRTLHYLGNIGNALSEDTAKPIKDSLKGTLEIGLIATLHHEFGQDKVYLLPVSAQGKDSESLDLGEPPNQKLSEYVFILPVILSVDDTQPVKTPQIREQTSTRFSWRN